MSVYSYIDRYYYSPHTRKMGRQLSPFVLEQGKISKKKIQEFLIKTYENKKHSTYKTYYAFLSSFLRKLKKDSMVDFTLQDINLPPIKAVEQIAPSLLKRIEKKDLELFLQVLKSEKEWEIYYFIKLLSCTGIRTQEAKDLDISNSKRLYVDGDFSVYYILGKGRKRRQIYIPTSLLEKIQKDLGSHPFKNIRFPTMFLKRFALKHHLTPFSPHQLRSYYGTTLLEKNAVPINLVAQLLGHTSVETTAKYYLRNKIDTKSLVI